MKIRNSEVTLIIFKIIMFSITFPSFSQDFDLNFREQFDEGNPSVSESESSEQDINFNKNKEIIENEREGFSQTDTDNNIFSQAEENLEVIRDPFYPIDFHESDSEFESKQSTNRDNLEVFVPSEKSSANQQMDSSQSGPKNPFPYDLSVQEFRVAAIVWHGRRPSAIFISPDKKKVRLSIGDKIGSEKAMVWKILENEVWMVIPKNKDYREGEVLSFKIKNY